MRIKFQPQGVRVEVEAGQTLLQAASAAGVAVEAVCGGRGTCGKCRVIATEGLAPLTETERARLTPEEQALRLPAGLPGGHRRRCGRRGSRRVAHRPGQHPGRWRAGRGRVRALAGGPPNPGSRGFPARPDCRSRQSAASAGQRGGDRLAPHAGGGSAATRGVAPGWWAGPGDCRRWRHRAHRTGRRPGAAPGCGVRHRHHDGRRVPDGPAHR